VSDAIEIRCSGCDAPLEPGDRFCEQCGTRAPGDEPASGVCRVCGGTSLDEDGYCAVCGTRERSGADRVESDLAWAAAVSDRGRVHHRNEDAFAIAAPTDVDAAVVVCDGISSSSAGDAAARHGAEAALAQLSQALDDRSRGGESAMSEAIIAAGDAVARVPWTRRADRDQPSCTLVAALCRGSEIVVGWVGDSRAYWVDDDGGDQLTTDDSWAQAQVSAGLMSESEARQDARAHSITRWIGADAPTEPPQIVTRRPARSGRLVVCSDGLWNYLSSPGELAQLIDALPEGASAAAVARALTDTAVLRGGRDNITVAVIEVGWQERSGS
jgi:serine/threonine protein phosphatase PrpC